MFTIRKQKEEITITDQDAGFTRPLTKEEAERLRRKYPEIDDDTVADISLDEDLLLDIPLFP